MATNGRIAKPRITGPDQCARQFGEKLHYIIIYPVYPYMVATVNAIARNTFWIILSPQLHDTLNMQIAIDVFSTYTD